MNRLKRLTILILIAAAILAARCTTGGAPPATVVPLGEDRYLIDPRVGWSPPIPPAVDRRFDDAWRFFLAGQRDEARQRFAEILAKNPDFVPATLGQAAVALREGNLAEAQSIVERVTSSHPGYTAADFYAAEIALAQKETRRAYDLYRDIARRADAPPTAAERVRELETLLFGELYAAAQAATGDESIRLLREALALNPSATSARILLGQKLIAAKQYEEARRELDPVINSGDVDKPEVQEALAEIEIGRGRYQEAIVRYERLARRSNDPRYARRLEEIKEVWNAANMPPQYQRALESESINRADFAVLLYWKVASVRFAQNVGTPPIAIDIGEVPGREELIRALALGVFGVDPVTRRVGPYTPITSATLTRLAARVLAVRGAPCARGGSAEQILAACSISDPTLGSATPEAPVSGRATAAVLDQLDRALR